MAVKKENQLRFVTLGVSAFAGIGPNTKVNVEYPKDFDITKELTEVEQKNGLVIVFPKGYNYVELAGDQGVGKTSLIECLKEATGGLAGENTLHQEKTPEGEIVLDKRYKDRFWGTDGNLYSLKVTKSTITLEQISVDPETGEPVLNAKNQEVASIQKTPKSLLQQVIGPAGISPMKLKGMNGAEQVKWMRSLFTLSVEAQKMEIDIRQRYDKAFADRTKVNNNYKVTETLLEKNDYYQKMEQWQTYFDTTKLETLQEAVNDVVTRKNLFDNATKALPEVKQQKVTADRELVDLKEELRKLNERIKAKEEAIVILNTRIEKGDQFLEENKNVTAEHEALKDKIQEAADYNLHKQNFDDVMEEKKRFDELGDQKIKANALVDELLQLKKEYIKSFTPDIPGLEVCIKDEGDTREGLFFNGKKLDILAESELWQLATQIWKALGVKIIYVENVSSLGTGAVEKFNEFLKTGGAYIFGTKMTRGEDNLKISFHNQIPIK